ncbi:hypothetical protein H1Q63_00890 [Desmonostoc muscorum CCALA 125]|nr:hypothetical protein [Desmonostoc muscorum CCALA 125]
MAVKPSTAVARQFIDGDKNIIPNFCDPDFNLGATITNYELRITNYYS